MQKHGAKRMTRTAYNSTLKPGHPLKRSWIKSKPRKPTRTFTRSLCPVKRKPPPTTLKKYDRILMPLCRELAMLYADGRCEKCGRSDRPLDMHHLWGKPLSMRWEPDGMAMLCHLGCHLYGTKEDPDATANPERMRQLIRRKRGEDWYNRMVTRFKSVLHISEIDVGLEKRILEMWLIAERDERT